MIYWRRRNDFQIVTLLDEGNNPKQVARELSISIWTVYRACKRFVEGKNETKEKNSLNLKSNARAYANCYLRRGKIKKEPCVKCGDIKSQMHHNDYENPLDVIWVCRKCHLELHKLQKNAKGKTTKNNRIELK